MQLQYLKYLLDIEQTNSLSKTAEANFISRQALTKNLHSLEKEIGTALYFVNGKKVFLTPAGRIVTDFAKTTLADEQRMYEKLSQLNIETPTDSSLKILSFSAITNLCTTHILDFFEFSMTPIDISVTVQPTQSLPDVIVSIKECPEDIIFLTISSEILETVLDLLSDSITSHAVLLEDTAAVCYSKDLSYSVVNAQLLNSETFFKNSIFSLIPSQQITFTKTYRNISCDAELIKNLLLNKNTIVYLPHKLAAKTFSFKPNRYIPIPQYKFSHLILFKSEIPFQDNLIIYLKSKLT